MNGSGLSRAKEERSEGVTPVHQGICSSGQIGLQKERRLGQRHAPYLNVRLQVSAVRQHFSVQYSGVSRLVCLRLLQSKHEFDAESVEQLGPPAIRWNERTLQRLEDEGTRNTHPMCDLMGIDATSGHKALDCQLISLWHL